MDDRSLADAAGGKRAWNVENETQTPWGRIAHGCVGRGPALLLAHGRP